MAINEEDLEKAVNECEFMIRKSKGIDVETEIVLLGSKAALASIIGKALCDIANIDKTMNKYVYFVCKSIVDEYEEKNHEHN